MRFCNETYGSLTYLLRETAWAAAAAPAAAAAVATAAAGSTTPLTRTPRHSRRGRGVRWGMTRKGDLPPMSVSNETC